jgi:hypothetical protein
MNEALRIDPGMRAAEAIFARKGRERLEEFLSMGEDIDMESRKFRKYSGFLKDNPQNAAGRRRALIEHFPGRFGSNGKQPIGDCGDDTIYGIYQGVRKTANRHVNGK